MDGKNRGNYIQMWKNKPPKIDKIQHAYGFSNNGFLNILVHYRLVLLGSFLRKLNVRFISCPLYHIYAVGRVLSGPLISY